MNPTRFSSLAQLGALLCLADIAFAEPNFKMGSMPQLVTLEKSEGGRLDGSTWSSAELTGKVQLLFYVDPDEKESNEPLEKALKKEEFPVEKFQSTAIINMGATWLPNVAIAATLDSKQKEFPRTIYVKDLNKKLVKTWSLADNAYHVLLFNRAGELLFSKGGALTNDEIVQLIATIKANL